MPAEGGAVNEGFVTGFELGIWGKEASWAVGIADDALKGMAWHQIRNDYCMLAASDTFKKVYMLELSYWNEGMPMQSYRSLLARYGLDDLPEPGHTPVTRRLAQRDISDYGRLGLRVIDDIGQSISRPIRDCTACRACMDGCPQSALTLSTPGGPPVMTLDQSRCAGVSCRRCEHVCQERVMSLSDFFSRGGMG